MGIFYRLKSPAALAFLASLLCLPAQAQELAPPIPIIQEDMQPYYAESGTLSQSPYEKRRADARRRRAMKSGVVPSTADPVYKTSRPLPKKEIASESALPADKPTASKKPSVKPIAPPHVFKPTPQLIIKEDLRVTPKPAPPVIAETPSPLAPAPVKMVIPELPPPPAPEPVKVAMPEPELPPPAAAPALIPLKGKIAPAPMPPPEMPLPELALTPLPPAIEASAPELIARNAPPATPIQETAPAPLPTAIVPVTEPKLSKESRDILKKIPSSLDKKKEAEKPPPPVDIDRAAPMDDLFGEQSGEISSHEAMGISIEVKKPNINTNYELERAYNALIAGNQEDAIAIYQQVLESEPNNKLGLFGLATTYHRLGQLSLARPYYGKLLTLDPENREALNNFLALVAEESPQEALRELEKLQAKNPDFSPIPAQIAIVYARQGLFKEAAHKMQQALQLSPENLAYRYDLAIMLDKAGDYPAAGIAYQQVMDAHLKGEKIPGEPHKIQERLTFIRSNSL